MNHESQRLKIQRFMASGETITPRIAYRICGTFCLSQRIAEIERDFKVDREWLTDGKKRVMSYWMPKARERARALVAA